MLIFKVIKVLRIITICLLVLFVLDYLFKWGLSKNLIIIVCLILIAYIIASLIMILTRVKQMGRKPPNITPREDDKVS